MENFEIINALKKGYEKMEGSLEILATAGMDDNNLSICHNTVANAIDEGLWEIAQALGYVWDYSDFIEDMLKP